MREGRDGDLFLLLGREVVDDAEVLSQLFGGLAFDLIRDLLAREIQHLLDVEVVRRLRQGIGEWRGG